MKTLRVRLARLLAGKSMMVVPRQSRGIYVGPEGATLSWRSDIVGVRIFGADVALDMSGDEPVTRFSPSGGEG